MEPSTYRVHFSFIVILMLLPQLMSAQTKEKPRKCILVFGAHADDVDVCDRYNFRVQQFNPSGIHLSSWRTTGLFDDSKHFPLGIAAGTDGAIYVVDHYAHCIQKYKP